MSPSTRRSVTFVALAATVVVPLALSWPQITRMPWAMSTTAILLVGGILTRRNPPIGLGCVAGAAILATATDQGPWPYLATVIIAFLCGRARTAGWTIRLVLIGAAAVFAALSIAGWIDPVEMLLTLVGAVVVPWWIGSDARVRASLRDAGWERAARLEREQQLAVDAVRQEERTRLAADMHDALGYELSVLALTAGAGEVDAANTSEQRAQFTRTREAAVRAVESLHDVLRLLREDESDQEASLDAIAELVSNYGQSGGRLDATLDINPSEYSDALRRGMYRIVRELLTNATKHAPGAPVQLSLAAKDDQVTICASNPRTARAAAMPGSGSGLAGITERVRVLGGTMTTSQEPGHFGVFVTLPAQTPAWKAASDLPPGPFTGTPEHGRGSRRWQTALFPLLALAVSAGLLVALNAATVENIGLSADVFERRLHVGMSLEEAEPRLPPSHLDELPAALSPPEATDGAQCRFYRGADTWLDLGKSYVQLCFADGTLVSKERIS